MLFGEAVFKFSKQARCDTSALAGFRSCFRAWDLEPSFSPRFSGFCLFHRILSMYGWQYIMLLQTCKVHGRKSKVVGPARTCCHKPHGNLGLI